MKLQLGNGFWMVATAIIILFTVFVVGRNAVHAVRIKRQIGDLNRERVHYREKIRQDSALIERLRYDDYLEEYARERYHMQRPDERVYLLEE